MKSHIVKVMKEYSPVAEEMCSLRQKVKKWVSELGQILSYQQPGPEVDEVM